MALRLVAVVAAATLALSACGADATVPGGSSAVATTPAADTTPAATSGGGASPAASSAAGVEPPVPPADPASVEAAHAVLATTSLDDPATIRAAVSAARDEGAAEAAAVILADPSATPGARWAAVLAYGTSGWDPAVLLPVLEDPSPTLRAMAAATLVGWGEAAAVSVLVELTSDVSLAEGSEPPLAIGAYAAEVLDTFVDGPDLTPGTESAAVHDAWQAWLTETGGALVFDPATGVWTAG